MPCFSSDIMKAVKPILIKKGLIKCPECGWRQSDSNSECNFCDVKFIDDSKSKKNKSKNSSKKSVSKNKPINPPKKSVSKDKLIKCPKCGKKIPAHRAKCIYCDYSFYRKTNRPTGGITSIISPESSLDEGYIPIPPTKPKKSYFRRETVMECPECGKKQSYRKEKCIDCGYDFKQNRKIEVEEYIRQLKGKGLRVPEIISIDFIKNTYFNDPYVYKNDNDLVEHIFKFIKFDPNSAKILYIGNDGKTKDNIIQCLKNKSLRGDVLIGDQVYSLLKSIGEFEKINEYLSKRYFVNIPNSLKSKEIVSNLNNVFSSNARQINEKDIILLNDFIKEYWKCWEMSQSSGDDMTKYGEKLEPYSLICYKYFKHAPLELSMNDLIGMFNLSLKLYELTDENVIDIDRLKDIQDSMDDFLDKICNLEKSMLEIEGHIAACCETYENSHFSKQLRRSFEFKTIKSSSLGKIKSSRLYILDASELAGIFDRLGLSFFDKVICHDDNQISLKEKFYLHLVSKEKITVVKLEGGE